MKRLTWLWLFLRMGVVFGLGLFAGEDIVAHKPREWISCAVGAAFLTADTILTTLRIIDERVRERIRGIG
jgi:hypothetical protein